MEVVQRVPVTCPRCEAPVAGDFKFCPTCAYRLKPGVASTEAREGPRPRRLVALAMSLMAALFVGLFAGIGFWLFRDRTASPSTRPASGIEADLPVDELNAATVRRFLVRVPNGTAYFKKVGLDEELVPMYVGELEVLRYEVPVSFYAEYVRDLTERVKHGESEGPTLERLWNARTEFEVGQATRYLSTWMEAYLAHHGATPGRTTPPPEPFLKYVPEEKRKEASTWFWACAEAIPFPWPDELGLLLLAPPSWAHVNNWSEFSWSVPPGTASLPVNEVTWTDAMAFCEWLHARSGGELDYRLPVMGEWTHAAHGGHPPGPDEWLYPWGSSEVYDACNNRDLYPVGVPPGLHPVTQPYFGADGDRIRDGRTADGIYAMAGNVAEWVLTQGERDQRVGESLRVYYDAEKDHEDFDALAYGGSFRSPLIECTVHSSLMLKKYHRSDTIGFRIVLQRRI